MRDQERDRLPARLGLYSPARLIRFLAKLNKIIVWLVWTVCEPHVSHGYVNTCNLTINSMLPISIRVGLCNIFIYLAVISLAVPVIVSELTLNDMAYNHRPPYHNKTQQDTNHMYNSCHIVYVCPLSLNSTMDLFLDIVLTLVGKASDIFLAFRGLNQYKDAILLI